MDDMDSCRVCNLCRFPSRVMKNNLTMTIPSGLAIVAMKLIALRKVIF
jgi:hypothetical protein